MGFYLFIPVQAMTTIICPDLISYSVTKCALLDRGLLFVHSEVEPSRGKNYIEVGEKSFKLITKKEYEKTICNQD